MKITQFAQNLHLLMLKSDAKKYHQFCTIYGLKQLILCPTRVTCNTLIDHTLASFPLRVSQKGVINVGLSDHQLIVCTRNISKFKTGDVHKYTNFQSLKNYRVDDYKKSLPRLQNFRRHQCSVFRFLSDNHDIYG